MHSDVPKLPMATVLFASALIVFIYNRKHLVHDRPKLTFKDTV